MTDMRAPLVALALLAACAAPPACAPAPAGPPTSSTPAEAEAVEDPSLATAHLQYAPPDPVPVVDTAESLAPPADPQPAPEAPPPLHDHGVPLAEDVAALHEEMAVMSDNISALADEVAALREDMEGYFERFFEDLKGENDRLRREVSRLAAGQDPATGPASPLEPEPPLEEATDEGDPEGPDEAWPAGTPLPSDPADAEETFEEILPAGPGRPFVFTSVSKSDRSPEEMARRGGNAPSLIRMVGTVPRGAGVEDLKKLGRELRDRYDAYDNINIEVFNDTGAARRYAEANELDHRHHVLSVSKHAASGRDNIMLVHGKLSVEVPRRE